MSQHDRYDASEVNGKIWMSELHKRINEKTAMPPELKPFLHSSNCNHRLSYVLTFSQIRNHTEVLHSHLPLGIKSVQ